VCCNCCIHVPAESYTRHCSSSPVPSSHTLTTQPLPRLLASRSFTSDRGGRQKYNATMRQQVITWIARGEPTAFLQHASRPPTTLCHSLPPAQLSQRSGAAPRAIEFVGQLRSAIAHARLGAQRDLLACFVHVGEPAHKRQPRLSCCSMSKQATGGASLVTTAKARPERLIVLPLDGRLLCLLVTRVRPQVCARARPGHLRTAAAITAGNA